MKANPRTLQRKSRWRKSRRRGSVFVEAAVCLPFVFLLVVAAIELSAGLHQQLAIRATVHECATRAAAGECTSDQIQTVAQQIVSQRGVTEYEITIIEVARTVNVNSVQSATVPDFLIPSSGATTNGLEDVPRGTILRLELVATRPPVSGFSLFPNLLTPTMVESCVFVKEK